MGTTQTKDCIILNLKGDFIVNIDSLKIKINEIPVDNKNVDVLYNNKLCKDTNKSQVRTSTKKHRAR